MAYWQSIARMFPKGRRRSKAAEHQLITSYRAVFTGNGTREAAEIVLADFARYTGFYQVSPGDLPADVLRHREGMRAAFARIFSYLNLSPEQMRGLQEAARAEASAGIEGEFE